jgi:ligand-binding SRPBCC domain-containing protein
MTGFERRSRLEAAPADVWASATSMKGINYELRPFLRMTSPRGYESIDAPPPGVEFVPGERLFRSWILLFGFLPVEYDDVTLVELEPGRSFRERSQLLTQRVWVHERTIDPAPGGCILTDRLQWEPRLGLPAALFGPMYRLVFRLRHRRLRRRFGGDPA